jgi:L-xylulokinase
MTGGVNEHPLMGQLKADVIGADTAVAVEGETAALGAALLAGIGVGVFNGATEAAAAASLHWRHYRPREFWRNRYDGRYVEAYAQLYPALRPIFRTVTSDEHNRVDSAE